MKARSAPSRSTYQAFTLIELLVVIAIIAILAAILFPVFAQARAKARAIVCLSNCKQMGTAANMYMQDYDEMVLPARMEYTNDVLGTHTDGTVRDWRRFWPYIIQPYLKNFGSLKCPDVPTGGGPNWADDPERNMTGGSIVINDTMSTWGNEDGFAAQTAYPSITKPAEMVQFADAAAISRGGGGWRAWDGSKAGREAFLNNPDDFSAYDKDNIGGVFHNPLRLSWESPGAPTLVPVPRHSGMCNVVFYDGHAKAIKLSQYWIRPGITRIAKHPDGSADTRDDWGGEHDIFGDKNARGNDNNPAAWK